MENKIKKLEKALKKERFLNKKMVRQCNELLLVASKQIQCVGKGL